MDSEPKARQAATLRPLSSFPTAERARVRGVLFDIDDTITTEGRLTAQAYGAMERLQDSGLTVVPITGRPAGWCDHIARMWPVDGVVGENGAFYFRYDRAVRQMIKRYTLSESERSENRARLDALEAEILAAVPGAGRVSDQAYRETDLAIDYREDVDPLPEASVQRIVEMFQAAGATAKISSIHVNGWYGDYDKLSMTRIMLSECFSLDLDADKHDLVFVGDSPNDAPMFAYFPNAVGVANVRDFAGRLAEEPAYITESRAGAGFAELAEALLAAH
ncbi:MAG: HAD-IIB family hydrolase [Kiloniellales bacterium]